MADYLFDLSKNFWEQAVLTDGKFDADKAAERGYSPAQYPAIKEFLGLDYDTAPLDEALSVPIPED
jgi:hypothetical protein